MIYLDSVTTIALNGLADSSGNLINNATVSATINDLDGNSITTLTLTSTGSGGNYTGLITPAMTATMQDQKEYVVAVTSTLSGSVIDYRQDTQLATYRGFNE